MPTSARQNWAVFTELFGKFAIASGADVGIDPYKPLSPARKIWEMALSPLPDGLVQ